MVESLLTHTQPKKASGTAAGLAIWACAGLFNQRQRWSGVAKPGLLTSGPLGPRAVGERGAKGVSSMATQQRQTWKIRVRQTRCARH